jgi:hypothetical protein
MKPPRTFGINREPLPKPIRHMVEQLSKAVSNISFGTTTDNTDGDMTIQCHKAHINAPGSPNTEFAVPHNLKHIPIGFIIISTNQAGHVYKSAGGTPWTAATDSAPGNIYLKADAAGIVINLIII